MTEDSNNIEQSANTTETSLSLQRSKKFGIGRMKLDQLSGSVNKKLGRIVSFVQSNNRKNQQAATSKPSHTDTVINNPLYSQTTNTVPLIIDDSVAQREEARAKPAASVAGGKYKNMIYNLLAGRKRKQAGRRTCDSSSGNMLIEDQHLQAYAVPCITNGRGDSNESSYSPVGRSNFLNESRALEQSKKRSRGRLASNHVKKLLKKDASSVKKPTNQLRRRTFRQSQVINTSSWRHTLRSNSANKRRIASGPNLRNVRTHEKDNAKAHVSQRSNKNQKTEVVAVSEESASQTWVVITLCLVSVGVLLIGGALLDKVMNIQSILTVYKHYCPHPMNLTSILALAALLGILLAKVHLLRFPDKVILPSKAQ